MSHPNHHPANTSAVVAELFAANDALSRVLRFVAQLDRLKRIRRANVVDDTEGLRPETTAEHSWHLAAMARALGRFAPPGTDLDRAVFLALVHDIPEILAGDTPAYLADATSPAKAAREDEAAAQLFGMLPEPEANEWCAAWQEFEAGQSATARFARAMDRLQPVLMHLSTGGATWRAHQVRLSQVRARVAPIEQDVPELWAAVSAMLDEGVRRGWLNDA